MKYDILGLRAALANGEVKATQSIRAFRGTALIARVAPGVPNYTCLALLDWIGQNDKKTTVVRYESGRYAVVNVADLKFNVE